MSKIFAISPVGLSTPMLFETFEKTFQEQGHSFVDSIEYADIIFFDFHSGLFGYDWNLINRVLELRLPVITFDAFDHFTGEGYESTFAQRLERDIDVQWNLAYRFFYVNDLVKVCFMRKMSKTVKFPSNSYPLELIQYTDHDFLLTDKVELFSRPIDICFIGNKATPRNNICEGLSKHFKCDFVLGEERLEHNEWLNRHRRSNLFIECGGGGESGGGFRSERTYQLITISPRLACYDEQLVENDFVDMEDTIIVGDALGRLKDGDVEKIKSVINDKDKLYDMYLKGVDRIHKYFNAEYRANYVLDVLKKNNVI